MTILGTLFLWRRTAKKPWLSSTEPGKDKSKNLEDQSDQCYWNPDSLLEQPEIILMGNDYFFFLILFFLVKASWLLQFCGLLKSTSPQRSHCGFGWRSYQVPVGSLWSWGGLSRQVCLQSLHEWRRMQRRIRSF